MGCAAASRQAQMAGEAFKKLPMATYSSCVKEREIGLGLGDGDGNKQTAITCNYSVSLKYSILKHRPMRTAQTFQDAFLLPSWR